MMLSLYSAKAIALQIRFRRIRMERPRRGGAYDVRYFFNDPPLCDPTRSAPKPSLHPMGLFVSKLGALPDVNSYMKL